MRNINDKLGTTTKSIKNNSKSKLTEIAITKGINQSQPVLQYIAR